MSEDSVPRFLPVRDLDKAQTALVCFCFPREDVNKLEVQKDSINPSQFRGRCLTQWPFSCRLQDLSGFLRHNSDGSDHWLLMDVAVGSAVGDDD